MKTFLGVKVPGVAAATATDTLTVQKFGPFTFASITDPATGVVGFGVSKLSEKDRWNAEMGKEVALGRAKSALEVKVHNAPIWDEIRKLGKTPADLKKKAELTKTLKTLQHHYKG